MKTIIKAYCIASRAELAWCRVVRVALTAIAKQEVVAAARNKAHANDETRAAAQPLLAASELQRPSPREQARLRKALSRQRTKEGANGAGHVH